MTQGTWNAVDSYLTDLLVLIDPVRDAALAASVAAGLPPIAVTPTEGKFLHLMARSIGARNILEIGTLGGYSTIWLARALPEGGRLLTLEAEPHNAGVARANFTLAGLDGIVELRLGKALDTLPQIAAEARDPFDLVFIDADKENNSEYFAWALKLSHRGSLIIVDNVVRNGAVADASSTDPRVLGTRRFLEQVAAEPNVSATVVQTVGSKGYDGFAIALVVEEP